MLNVNIYIYIYDTFSKKAITELHNYFNWYLVKLMKQLILQHCFGKHAKRVIYINERYNET